MMVVLQQLVMHMLKYLIILLSNLNIRRGISLYNSSGEMFGWNIAGAVISGNTISNAVGYSGEFGIRSG